MAWGIQVWSDLRHGWVYEHIAIAEKILGRRLRANEEVHHVDEDHYNNSNENLVICTTNYHRMIHQRMRAMEACGNPNWRKCKFCKEYDDPKNLHISPSGNTDKCRHRKCESEYNRNYALNH